MFRANRLRAVMLASALTSPLLAMPAFAQEADEDAIIVNAEREIVLDRRTDTGSRLGLSIRETPATLDVLTQERFLERGLRTSNEALNSAPGITAFNAGGAPGTLTMRGFGGQTVSVAYDGVHLTNTTMTNRDFDSFAFERVEVLKGPSSVLYGEGALGGTVNYVTKKPMPGVEQVQGLATYGSLDTYRLAGDINVPIGETVAVRAVASRSGSDGFIDRASTKLTTANAGLAWQPSEKLSTLFAVEYARNRNSAPYWGTPLVPASAAVDATDIIQTAGGLVLDRSLRSTSYQYLNSFNGGDSLWLRSTIDAQINDNWKISNNLSYNHGERKWFDAYGLTYVAATNRVNRRADYIVNTYDFWNERLTLSSDGPVFGHRNRFLVGAEFNRMDHFAVRRFGPAIGIDARAPVNDPNSPVLGLFPEVNAANFPGAGNFVDLGMDIKGSAIFAEDAFNITDRLLIVGGLRFERLELDQTQKDYNLVTNSGFEKTYKPYSHRIGAVWTVEDSTQLYAQFSRGAAPVTSLTLLQASNSPYKLTTGESVEGGVKASLFSGRIETTAAVYWIRQKDIITRDPSDPTITIQGGTQSSRGVELSASAQITPQFRLDANYAYVDAHFDELIEAGGADRSGNRAPNIPDSILNAFALYRLADLPLTFTAGMRIASSIFADNANTTRVDGYTVADASVGYRFPFGDLTLRVRNIGDALYVVNAGSTTVYLAEPRTADLTFRTRF